MYLLITYDVNIASEGGANRLRRVAKCCVNYGQRVQNSVFECMISEADFVHLKSQLSGIIDHETDTIRIYNLGKNYRPKIQKLGKNTSYNFEDPLIL